MKIKRYLIGVFVLFLVSSCATSTDSSLDSARFALDECSTTNLAPCTTAANEAQTVLDANPNDVDAVMIRAGALSLRAGIDVLDILAELAKTGVSGGFDNDTEKFKVIHNAVVSGVQNIDDLRTAITTLTSLDATTLDANSEVYKDYYFQLGMLQAIESFTLPTITAQPTSSTAVTITNITATEQASTLNDFLNADNNLILGGIADANSTGWELVQAVRQNYCILHNISGGGGGFTTEELQDLMSCQLCIDVTNTSICPEQPGTMLAADGDFQSAGVVTCASFDFTACDNVGNSAP